MSKLGPAWWGGFFYALFLGIFLTALVIENSPPGVTKWIRLLGLVGSICLTVANVGRARLANQPPK